jgi:hypothetical protein
MRSLTRILHAPGIVLALASALATVPGTAAGERARTAVVDGAGIHIDAVLRDPEVARRINAWGLSVADVRHDVNSMTPHERLRLAKLLNDRWRTNKSYDRADLQAQFLVTMSLMRESVLFAGILSTGASRLR